MYLKIAERIKFYFKKKARILRQIIWGHLKKTYTIYYGKYKNFYLNAVQKPKKQKKLFVKNILKIVFNYINIFILFIYKINLYSCPSHT